MVGRNDSMIERHPDTTVACWIISNEYKNPHGKIFKSWCVF